MYVAPDTNFLLRYKLLWDIKPSELQSSDAIIWILAPQVIRELNQIKDRERDNALKRRARRFLKHFELLISSADERFIYAKRAGLFDYASFNLDPANGDHRVLAELIAYREQANIEGIAVISADFNMRTEARSYDFLPIDPDDSLELPEPEDPKNAEICDLRSQLDNLRAAAPVLHIALASEGHNAVVYAELAPDKSDLPKPVAEDDETNDIDIILAALNEKNERYDLECSEYAIKIEKISIERWCLKNRIYPVQLVLRNSGVLAANRVSVDVEVVGIVRACEGIPNNPDWPIRPKPYKVKGQTFSSGFSMKGGYPTFYVKEYKDLQSPVTAISGPRINRSSNGYSIEYFQMAVGQEAEVRLKPFFFEMPFQIAKQRDSVASMQRTRC